MSGNSSDDELKLNRRLFLAHTAAMTATATLYSIALKTDALGQGLAPLGPGGDPGDGMPYPYHSP